MVKKKIFRQKILQKTIGARKNFKIPNFQSKLQNLKSLETNID